MNHSYYQHKFLLNVMICFEFLVHARQPTRAFVPCPVHRAGLELPASESPHQGIALQSGALSWANVTTNTTRRPHNIYMLIACLLPPYACGSLACLRSTSSPAALLLPQGLSGQLSGQGLALQEWHAIGCSPLLGMRPCQRLRH